MRGYVCLGSYEHLFTLENNQSGVECRGAWAWVPVWLACPFWTSGRTAQPAGRRAQPLSVCPGCFSYSSSCCWMLTKPDLVLTCKEDLVYGSPGGRYPRRVSAAGQCVRPQWPMPTAARHLPSTTASSRSRRARYLHLHLRPHRACCSARVST